MVLINVFIKMNILSQSHAQSKGSTYSLKSLTSHKVGTFWLHLLLFSYTQPPNWNLKSNLEKLQGGYIGGNRGKKIFSNSFPINNLNTLIGKL